MARSTAVAALLCALVLPACGDPILVTGDALGLMRIVAGVGDSAGTRVDSIATRTRLTSPSAAAFDDMSGTLYIADQGSSVQSGNFTRNVARIFAVSSAGKARLLLSGGGCSGGFCLERARTLVLGPDGNLYAADDIGHRIVRFDITQRTVATIAGDGTAGDSPDGTAAAQARLNRPVGLAFTPDGRLFVSEQDAHRVRNIGTDGTLRTIAGTGTRGATGDGGPALQATLASPSGLAFSGGTLFIADTDNHRIRAVDIASNVIRTVAGNGLPGFSGDGAAAEAARLQLPRDVAVGLDGISLFINDAANQRIRLVNLATGRINTIAGTGGTRFTGTGLAAGATALFNPAGVVASTLGFLFIVDAGHAIVWRTTLRL